LSDARRKEDFSEEGMAAATTTIISGRSYLQIGRDNKLITPTTLAVLSNTAPTLINPSEL
jgi:hypothetical protein